MNLRALFVFLPAIIAAQEELTSITATTLPKTIMAKQDYQKLVTEHAECLEDYFRALGEAWRAAEGVIDCYQLGPCFYRRPEYMQQRAILVGAHCDSKLSQLDDAHLDEKSQDRGTENTEEHDEAARLEKRLKTEGLTHNTTRSEHKSNFLNKISRSLGLI